MSNFIRHRRGECPVCQGARKDCRTSVSTNITFCRETTANPADFVFKGTDANGFGLWLPLELQVAFDDNKDKARQEWRQKQLEREQREKERLKGSATPSQRNSGYTAILEGLELTSQDVSILKNRGEGWESLLVARSVEKFQPVNVTNVLPGYNVKRQSLNNGASGILFPVPDVNGNIIALRLYNPLANKENGLAKYSWLSTESESLHLSNGELPIGVFRPSVLLDSRVYICEGVEIKPRLLAERLGAIVIGIPGASTFGNYPKQLKGILESLGVAELVLIPDAGALFNPNIRPAFEKLNRVLKSIGVTLSALWWGQIEKSDLDGDELTLESLKAATVKGFDWMMGLKRVNESAQVNQVLSILYGKVKTAVCRVAKGLIQDKNKPLDFIPEKESYQGEIVKFLPGTGDKIYEKAARLGYKYILDQSPTGAGKTHTVSKLTPGHFFVNPDDQEETEFRQIIYCSQSHRNPNNEVIESDFYEMVSRTTGYELDYDKLTPLGRPYRVKADDKTPPELRTKSNCHWSGLFNQAYASGHSTEGFCGACQHFDKCRTTNGDGFGYLSEANQFKKQSKVHAHLKGLPVGSVDGNTVLIVDEAETAEWVQAQQITESDVRAVFKALKEKEPEIYKLLLPLKDSLIELFDEENNPSPYFGWTRKEIPIECPKSALDYIAQIQVVEDSLRPSATEMAEGKTLTQAFLVNLIHILTDKKRGTWSGSNKTFNIYSVNGRNLDHAKNAHCTIFQDATMSRKMLALTLGCEESDILLIRQEMPQKHNLTINQYVGTGRLTNQRSQDEIDRAELWRDYLSDRDIGWVEYKAFAQEGDLIHGGDGRGSNAYKNKQEIGIMGVYRPNMSAVLTELEAILGQPLGFDSPEFQEYYGHKVAANVLQEIGRLRNNRRDEDGLIVHIVGDGDLSFLEDLGLDLRVIDATDINPELANIEHRTKARNLNMGTAIYRELGLEGLLNMDQKTFAERLGITAAAFCQWGKRLFGRVGDKAGEWYKRFKDAILALVAPKPTQISDPERAATIDSLANDVFPILVRTTCTSGEFGKEFAEILGIFEWDDVLEALNRLAMNLSARLLFRILRFAG